jgi:hypothetical protein
MSQIIYIFEIETILYGFIARFAKTANSDWTKCHCSAAESEMEAVSA